MSDTRLFVTNNLAGLINNLEDASHNLVRAINNLDGEPPNLNETIKFSMFYGFLTNRASFLRFWMGLSRWSDLGSS